MEVPFLVLSSPEVPFTSSTSRWWAHYHSLWTALCCKGLSSHATLSKSCSAQVCVCYYHHMIIYFSLISPQIPQSPYTEPPRPFLPSCALKCADHSKSMVISWNPGHGISSQNIPKCLRLTLRGIMRLCELCCFSFQNLTVIHLYM